MPVLRYFAAIRAAAGVDEEPVEGETLAEALASARGSKDARFGQVLAICSFLIDGEPVGARDHSAVRLTPSSAVDCLPPFAGG